MKKYILENINGWFKKFLSKHGRIKATIAIIVVLFICFFLLGQILGTWNTILNFFNSCSSEKTDEEITIEWLEENFRDTTYNVLLIPFNDYQEGSEKRLKIERALEQRLDDLRNKYFFSTNVKSSIKIKCYLEIPEFLSIDSISAIGNGVKADLIIYGDIYDLYNKPSKRTNIKYIIPHNAKIGLPIKEKGETGLIEFNSLDEIREGYIIKDIDYLTMWLFCNEEIYYKNLDNALIIWNSIENDFKESIFSKSKAYLSAYLGQEYYHSSNLSYAKVFLKKSMMFYEIGEVFSLIGLVYSDISKMDSSKIMQLKALQISPNSLMVNVNLGVLYKSLGNSDSAKYFYLKSLSINPLKHIIT